MSISVNININAKVLSELNALIDEKSTAPGTKPLKMLSGF